MKKVDLLGKVKNTKLGIKAAKHAPELMMGAGVIGFGATVFMASRATLKLGDIIGETAVTIDAINDTAENRPEEYSMEDRRKDLTILYSQTGIKVAKLYLPAVITGAASVGLLIGSHNILKGRNVALMAAYKAVDEGFKEYRERVVADLGEEQDYIFRHGLIEEKKKVKYTDKDGKEKTKTVSEFKLDRDASVSEYAKFFDELNINWSDNPDYNMLFLRTQQNYANDLLKARGHLFLNEVYSMLGIPHTSAGAIVGWTIGAGGDNYVDFGIFTRDSQVVREFVNGYERSILLDFNVDGVIWDMI